MGRNKKESQERLKGEPQADKPKKKRAGKPAPFFG
jgi:hypothetical protein